MKKLLLVMLAAALVMGAFAGCASVTQSPTPDQSAPAEQSAVTTEGTAGMKNITVEIVHADKTTKTVEISTNAENLRAALEQENLIQGTDSSAGLFVKTVDGETADDSKQQWWNFSKSGQSLMTGVDATPVADGDKFEITLTTGY